MRTTRKTANIWLVLALTSALFRCGSGSDPEQTDTLQPAPDVAEEDQTYVPTPDITQPDYGDVAVTPEQSELLQWHAALVAESENMTTQELMDLFYQERPYLEHPSFNSADAEFMDLVKEKLALTTDEEALIQDKGFAVLDRVRYSSHPMGYRDLFENHIPVLITTDSILFAMHKSYDMMLKDFEEQTIIKTVQDILEKAHAQVEVIKTESNDELFQLALSDVDLMYTVARSLLAGAPVAPVFEANVAIRDQLLAQVEDLQPKLIELFGRPYPCEGPGCAYDFSQFKPRGHYTLTDELKRYFKTMIWLGRTEMVLTRYHREFVASALMRRTIEESGSLETWVAVDQALQIFVGKSDNLTPVGFGTFLTEQQSPSLETILDPVKAEALMASLETSSYGDQKILSQIISVDPMSTEPTLLPPVFLFMGQRFVVDSYVFSNVVYDRIYFEGQPQERYMPSPLDAMFVLGFQETLPLLKTELDTWHYASNLSMLRHLVDAYDAGFWGESMYNVWLNGIRSLALDTSDAKYPDAVRTPEYALKMLNTSLASWAELRHDTILYVKQSYTGVGCDYPDGYVEPFPEFFKRINTFATSSKTMLEGMTLDMGYGKQMALNYLTNLETASKTLEAIAEKQLAQEPRLPEETAFIKELVQDESMCGSAPFSGWYAQLFYNSNDTTFNFDPTIADVHTDPNSTNILHVGTGFANAMVMVVNTTCGLRTYVGPVSSYYEDQEPNFMRLTDEEWKSQFSTDSLPPRPTWTKPWIKQ